MSIPMKVYAIILTTVLAISAKSYGCSFTDRTDEEKFEEAERVFRAKVMATKLVTEMHEAEEYEVVRATYKLIESYKGKNPRKGTIKELPFGPGNCMLGLLTGMEYVVYLKDNEFVTLPSGSWGYFNPEGTEVLPELEKLRRLSGESM